MALVIADRVRETTTTTGTGAVTLAGAYTSFQSFLAAVGNGNSTYYTIASAVTGEWEVGIGTYTSASNTLSRTTVLASSNAGSLVNFSSGAKDVFVTQPAERSILVQSAGSGLFSGVAAFTANGVPYANSTSTLTTGSALTFDGTNFATTGNISAGTNKSIALNASSTTDVTRLKWNYDGTTYAWIERVNNSGDMAFGVQSSEGMRLTSTGLGIGTTSPSEKLAVNGRMIALATGSGYTVNPAGGIFGYYSAGTPTTYVQAPASGQIQFWGPSTSAWATLDSSGNLGIGTSSPGYKLDVNGAINTSSDLISQGNNARLSLYRSTGINYFDWASGQALYFSTQTSAGGGGRSTLMVIDSSGNLGIGTSSPNKGSWSKALTLEGASNEAYELVTNGTYMGWFAAGGSSVTIGTKQANPFIFFTSDTERMRLDASGNLGLGVTPSAWTTYTAQQIRNASVYGWSGGNSFAALAANTWYGGSPAGYRYISTDFATEYYQYQGAHVWRTAASGTAGTAITFTQAMTLDASGKLGIGTTSPGAQLTVIGSAAKLYVDLSGDNYYDAANHVFRNFAGTERARIDSSGALLIGTTATGLLNLNYFYFDPASGYGGNAVVGHVSGTSSGVPYFTFAYNASNIGSITQSGTTAVLYNTTSDQRLKENIADADSASTLIDSLQVRKFDWKSDGSHQRYGFVAQELVTVAPEAVHQPADPEEMMAVDYSKLVPMLVKEIQSLRKRLADAGIA